jgi:hypothetical protein
LFFSEKPTMSPGLRTSISKIQRIALAWTLAAAAALHPLSGQETALGRGILEISTLYFDVYFPAALEEDARRLASFADGIYDTLAQIFPDGAAEKRRFPVLLVEGNASLNGSFTSYPSDRIRLEVAPSRLGSDLGSFADDLREIFAHELAHGLSLSTRGPVWSFWSRLMGDAVSPTLWVAPTGLVEGAAVATEGLAAPSPVSPSYGRTTDPLARALIQQDILEGKYKSFWQAAGAWDAYPYGRLPYIYGGFFTEYLLRSYGPDRYAELWREMSSGALIRGIDGLPPLKGAFEKVYGHPLDFAWAGFRSTMAIRAPVIMEAGRLTRSPGSISAMAVGTTRLYWADAAAGAVMSLEAAGGAPRRLFAADGRIGRLDLSRNEDRLLVSWVKIVEGREVPLVIAWDLERGRFVGGERRGLREAAFAGGADPEAILAIRPEAYRTDLVLASRGEERVLLRGGPERLYAWPLSLDGRIVYCLARDSAKVLLLRLDGDTGLTETLVPGLPLEHLRSLSGSASPEGIPLLALSFASSSETEGSGSLYRAAILEDSAEDPRGPGLGPVLRRQESQLSGSVLMPALASGGGSLFYVGRFSDGEYPCVLEPDDPALSFRSDRASWAALDPSFKAPAGGKVSADFSPTRASLLPLLLRSFRYPSVGPDLDAAGIGLVGEDLSGLLAWKIEAHYAWKAQGANLGLGLSLDLKPWNLDLSLSDRFIAAASGAYYRRSGVDLDAGRYWSFLPSRRRLRLEVQTHTAALAAASGSAYGSEYFLGGTALATSVGYSSYAAAYFPPFSESGWGITASLDGEWRHRPLSRPYPALSATVEANGALPFLGLEAAGYLSFSPDGSLRFGPAGRELVLDGGPSVLMSRYPEFQEYRSLGVAGALYAFAEASFLAFSAEVQRRVELGKIFVPLYVQRFQIRGGLRGAYLGELGSSLIGLSSAYGQALVAMSPLLGVAVDLRVRAGVEASWAFHVEPGPSQLRLSYILSASY